MHQGWRVGKVHVCGVSSIARVSGALAAAAAAFSIPVLRTTQGHWTPAGLTLVSLVVTGTTWTSGVGPGG